MMRDGERMSRVDTAWLRMDSDANLMMINGVWLLAPKLGRAALAARVETTLLRHDRFRQKVVHDPIGASWREDDTFDLGHHVVAETLDPAPGEAPEDALKRRVAELATRPLDAGRPLWQMHLIEDLDERRSALVSRIHHCIADGIALISVMLQMADGAAPAEVAEFVVPSDDDAPAAEDPAEAMLRRLTEWSTTLIGLYGEGVAKAISALAEPSGPVARSLVFARAAVQAGGDLAALALMADDSPTRLKGKPGSEKKVAWGEPLPLDAVKAVGKALGCSVNDVLLGCVAGAVGRYLAEAGDDPAGQEIRAMVPVNLRRQGEEARLGNKFGLVPLVLPIGIGNPVARTYEVHRRMNALKGSYQPLLAFGVLALAGLVARPVQAALLDTFARKATAVMTNVPGPREPLAFCGSTIERVMFWVPQSGDIGVGASILSYAGSVQFSLITDAGLCPEPERIVAAFGEAFESLLWLALMLPWD